MTALLRIVSTANPGQRANINMPGGSEDGILCMVPGSLTDVNNGDGTAQMSFVVFAKNYPVNLRTAVRNIDALLARAAVSEATGMADDVIVVQVASKNEGVPRQAQVLGGAVSAIDDAIVNSALERNAGLFAVTITRRAAWELAAAPISKVWSGVAPNGGTAAMPDEMFTGTMPGRIEALMVTPSVGSFRQCWVGVKRATAGGLDNFNPQINVGSASVPPGVLASREVAKRTGDQYVNDSAMRVGFVTRDGNGAALGVNAITANVAWRETVYVPFYSWNSTITGLAAENETVRRRAYNEYLGRYRLLLRYYVEAPEGVKFGVQAASGWAASNSNIQQTVLAAHYLPDTLSAWAYVDLGTVTVGGGRMSKLSMSRQRIESFTVALNLALFGAHAPGISAEDYAAAVDGARIWLDEIVLVPADNMLRMRSSTTAGGGYRMEYQRDIDGRDGAYMVRSSSAPGAWRTAGYEGAVREGIADYEAMNFVSPVEVGSKIVFVNDGDRSATIGMSVVPRVQNYS